MTNRLIAIYDGTTNTYIEREATDAEQAEIDIRETKAANEKISQEQKEAADLELKKAALIKLGLSEDQGIVLGMLPAAKIIRDDAYEL